MRRKTLEKKNNGEKHNVKMQESSNNPLQILEISNSTFSENSSTVSPPSPDVNNRTFVSSLKRIICFQYTTLRTYQYALSVFVLLNIFMILIFVDTLVAACNKGKVRSLLGVIVVIDTIFFILNALTILRLVIKPSQSIAWRMFLYSCLSGTWYLFVSTPIWFSVLYGDSVVGGSDDETKNVFSLSFGSTTGSIPLRAAITFYIISVLIAAFGLLVLYRFHEFALYNYDSDDMDDEINESDLNV